MKTLQIGNGPEVQQQERAKKQLAESRKARHAVVARRAAQRLARLSLPLRRGQGRDPFLKTLTNRGRFRRES